MGRAAFSTFSVDRAERISPPIFWLNFQFSSLVTRFKLNMKFLVMLFWIFKYFLNTKAVRWMSKDVKSISHNRTHMCIKGQMKSDCIYEIIDFPKYHRKKLINFCPKMFFLFFFLTDITHYWVFGCPSAYWYISIQRLYQSPIQYAVFL